MIYLNGSILSEAEARIDPFDRGFTLGDGLFETLRAYDGHPFRLEDHLQRMEAAASALDIPLPVDMPAVAEAVAELLEATGLRRGDASIRITLSRGTGPRGLAPPPDPRPNLVIAAAPYAPLPENCAAVTVQTRRNEGSPLSRMKSLSALDNVLASREAAAAGADEAILLNNAGHAACGARANIFAVMDEVLVTPPSSDGVLPGIARRVVCEIAQGRGIPCDERSLPAIALLQAREIFVTNSLFEIRSLASLDGRAIPDVRLATRLRAEYQAMARHA